jgi:hypothetical protein
MPLMAPPVAVPAVALKAVWMRISAAGEGPAVRVESAEVCRRLGEFLTRHDRRDALTGTRHWKWRAVELLEAVATPGRW